MGIRLGIDVGGTFTDYSLLDTDSDKLVVYKAATEPQSLSRAILQGVRELLVSSKVAASSVEAILHATTITSNTILERKGPATGLLTTAGFRDILEIGREVRYDVDDPFIVVPPPIIPRYLRKEVLERIDAHGMVIVPIDQNGIIDATNELLAEAVQSLAVVFLHSYINDTHERVAEEIIRARFPEMYLSISSTVARQHREFERTSTTVINAYIQPVVKQYLDDLETGLQKAGFPESCRMRIMTSTGGLVSVPDAAEMPVKCIESGPAAGVLAAQYFGARAGEKNLVSFDMGGTTAKVSVIVGGQISRVPEAEASRMHRLKKGSGYPIMARSVDLLEIGAGGGSLAYIDKMGLLKVGPESSGAMPGPACYSLGGDRPTVTDADLVLGYLNPDYFLGGRMRLSYKAAHQAIQTKCAQILAIDVLEAAAGIFEVVNEHMVSLIRVNAAERGIDVRKYSLLAFGGAGPVHAYDLARRLSIRRVICPPQSGVGSSLGLLVSPPMFELGMTHVTRLNAANPVELQTLLEAMEGEAIDALNRMGIAKSAIMIDRSAEVQYVGQDYQLEVPLAFGPIDDVSLRELEKRFNERYRKIYGVVISDSPAEAVNWRVCAYAPTMAPNITVAIRNGLKKDLKRKGERDVYFPEVGSFTKTCIYNRDRLRPHDMIQGPAIIEELESTIVVGPQGRLTVDDNSNAIIDIA